MALLIEVERIRGKALHVHDHHHGFEQAVVLSPRSNARDSREWLRRPADLA